MMDKSLNKFLVQKVLTHYLKQLEHIITLSRNTEPKLLDARLSEDMFDFYVQCQIVCNMALRFYAPLSRNLVPNFEQEQKSWHGILQQITDTKDFIRQHELADNWQEKLIEDKAGFQSVALPGIEFFQQFALPNLIFHLTLVYTTAKLNGVKVSKGDFDGFHHYPEGFSFQ